MAQLAMNIRSRINLGAPAQPVNADPTLDYFLVVTGDSDFEEQLKRDNTTGTRKIEGVEYTLIQLNNTLYYTKPKPQAPVTVDMEGGTGPAFVNKNYDWLTYETVLNKPVFRKTNQRRYVGLYLADTADLKLWIRDEMPDEALAAFCESVFPDHTPDELKEMSDRSWWWKLQPDVAAFAGKTAPYRKAATAEEPPEESIPIVWPRSAAADKGSRSGLRLHLPRYAVLPYNYWDNEGGSRALGSAPEDKYHEIPILQIKVGPTDATCWEMWRTASRSCMMLLKPVKAKGELWKPLPWTDWQFGEGKTDRENFKNTYPGKFPERYKSDAFKTEVQKTDPFNLKNWTPHHFSVKTGVVYVGFEKQPGKDAMGDDGEWLIGCLRSDLIKTMQKLVKKSAAPEELTIQTEIAMVLERQESAKMKAEKKGEDGVAFRDMKVLDPDRFYLAPLSIPFIDTDMKTLTEEFIHVDNPVWRAFWQKHWVEALARAKGWFLMRYGMQHANPNVQNYLIEFPSMDTIANLNLNDVKSRVIIRDVADALVVRQVMWALFGEDKACPTGELEFTALKTAGLPALRFNFRTEASGKKSETGSTDQQFAKHGIHLLWQRFSAFYAADKGQSASGDKLDQCPPVRLSKVLRLLSEWLVAHAVVYVRTIEKALGHEFGAIRWDELVARETVEERFPTVKDRDKFSRSAAKDKDWEDNAGFLITAYFNDEGRQKVCDYHNRKWVDATPAFTVRLLSDASEPMPTQLVYYKCNDGTEGQRMSDPAGEIPFYSKTAADFTFEWWYRDPGQAATGVALVKEKLTLTGLDLTPPVPVPTTVAVADPGPMSGAAMKVSAAVTMGTRKALGTVAFAFNGGALGAPLTAAPFEATVDTTKLKNGDYPLQVTVKDTASVVTTGQRQVTVANALPVAKIDTAAVAVTVATPNVTGSATVGAGMALQSISLALDGNPIQTVSGPDFDIALPTAALTTGSHTVTAKAVDAAGNESAEAALVVAIA